jgi:nucleotide-binding universal stress UspA family protein
VAYKLLEDVGSPADQIMLESQRYDLVVLGREPRFRFATQSHPDDTSQRVLRHGPRPVVTVPEKPRVGATDVVAYDGSLQSARALFAFWACGVAEAMPIRVVSVASTAELGSDQARSAIQFLDAHGIKADLDVIASNRDPATELSEAAERLDAGLIVAGAYGQPRLREFFLGSVTRALSRKGDFPLFLAH